MKKLNLLFTAILLLCCVGTAKAVEVTIDGIKYDVITKAKQATVIRGGSYSGDIVIPSEITYNNVTCSVTSIGDDAFYNCYILTSVTIPNSVTSIGSYAFYGCNGLKEVHINDIAAWCNIDFKGYSANPLYYANNLYLNNELITELVIPNGVTSIGYNAFRNCEGLTSVTIPNSVKSIGQEAFDGCTALTSITIPNSVTSIGYKAFSGCSGLTSVTIGNSVTSIGEAAFDDCTALTNIVIPSSVTSIGKWAFATCSAIETIVVDSENNVYDSRNNCNAIIETATNKLVLGCKNTVIPNDVTAIGGGAFDGCTGLTQITIPNSITNIEVDAFFVCSGLKTVYNFSNLTFSKGSSSDGYIAYYADNVYNVPNGSIEGDYIFDKPNNVNTLVGYLGSETELTLPADYNGESYVIGESAFEGNNTITSITIPNSVTSIGNQAFSNCDNLTDVYCLATNVPYTYDNPFAGSYPEYMTLHVPAEAINSYKTTEPWSTFGNIIVYVTPKCTAPVIEYRNGELIIECQTKNAEFVTTITNDYTGNYNSNAIALTATYNISVYATATGHDNSDTVNATLCWIECDCSANDNTTDVINVPAKALFVTSNNGTINISCSLEGEVVELYTSDAMYIGSTTIENGCATIESGLSKGDIAIIQIAEKSIKIILN